MLCVDEVKTSAQFEAVKPLWEKLAEGNSHRSPFYSHDWFRCCLRGYKQQKELCILLVKEGPDLIGVAPFWEYLGSMRKINVRRIEFINSPDTPFVDFICEECRKEEISDAIVNYLFNKRRNTWDVLFMSQWPVESVNFKTVRAILHRQNRNVITGTSSLAPYISIQGEWNDFLQTLSLRFRKTHRNIINRMSKLKKVEIQCYRDDPEGDVFKDIIDVSRRSWKQRQGIAISSSIETRLFFETLTKFANESGCLLLWLLRADGVPIAMEYDLAMAGKVYALRSDFDEEYKEYSPGSYLEYHIMKALFEEGYTEYNAGPGLNTYKLHWTEHIRENRALCIYNDTVKGRMLWFLESRLLPPLKEIKKLLRENPKPISDR